MKSSRLLAILVLQALLVSAAVAKGQGPKKPCCAECTSWSGVYTCDDLLPKCPAASACKNCVPVATDKGTKYRCRDFLPEGCGCNTN